MAYESPSPNESNTFPEMTEAEKLAVRKLFFTTVTGAIRRDGRNNPEEHDKVHLNSTIGNQEFVIITIGSFTDSNGSNGIISLYRTTGTRSGDLTAYEPDQTTGFIVRRELSRENRRKMTETLLGVLDDNTDQNNGTPLADIVDDNSTEQSMSEIEPVKLPLVWPVEMQWLAEVVRHGFPRR